MLIKVKTNYGHVERGLVKLKTPQTPPFHVSDEKGEELIKRGIAIKAADDEPAAEETTPAAPAAAVVPYEELTRPELLAIAKERGLDVDSKTKKQDIINALKEAAE